MKFILRVAVIFYVTIILALSIVILVFVFNIIPLEDIINGLKFIYSDEQVRLILGVAFVVVILMNHIFLNAFSDRQQRGRTIAFDNPSGRVSVSLSAMEDLVRRLILRVPEVKEVRSAITAVKKGLRVEAKITLNADVNIPEMTSRLQELVKKKVQNTVGLEEDVVVRVHISKIIPTNKDRQSKGKEEEQEESNTTVPFQGYRA